jgi:hypothetical protein
MFIATKRKIFKSCNLSYINNDNNIDDMVNFDNNNSNYDKNIDNNVNFENNNINNNNNDNNSNNTVIEQGF